MDKPYLVTGRIRNNRFWSACKEKWPKNVFQYEMALSLDVKYGAFNSMLNMNRYPVNRHGDPTVTALRVAKTLGKPFEFLFADELYNMADSPKFNLLVGQNEWGVLAGMQGWPLKEYAHSLKVAESKRK